MTTESSSVVARLTEAAKHAGLDGLRDGSWFRKIVTAHVKKHGAAVGRDEWDRQYPGLDVEERATRRIEAAARKAAATGALASVGASTGELLSLFTEGLAAPVGLPATIGSMAAEAAYTALLQIDLVCDLASIYGVPFDPEDAAEIATLFGLALEIDERRRRKDEDNAKDAPKGLTARLIELEDGDVATRIGRKMLEDSVLKNVVPVVGVAISARWNYVATRKLAAAVKRYVRYRCALRHALGRLRVAHVQEPELLVEGAWLLATTDGEATHEEMMAIAAIVEALPEDKRHELRADRSLGDDEEEWFDALARTSPEMHDALLDVLYLVAATDKELQIGERRFLRRVGKTLGTEIEYDRIEHICEHLAEGDDLPEGFFHCS